MDIDQRKTWEELYTHAHRYTQAFFFSFTQNGAVAVVAHVLLEVWLYKGWTKAFKEMLWVANNELIETKLTGFPVSHPLSCCPFCLMLKRWIHFDNVKCVAVNS